MLQDLNRENQALRQLVKELSSFIGEGIGGFLPKLGWDINSFEEFKNRSETDTMNDSFQHRKKNPGQPAPVVPLLAGQKRRTEELPGLGRKKSKVWFFRIPKVMMFTFLSRIQQKTLSRRQMGNIPLIPSRHPYIRIPTLLPLVQMSTIKPPTVLLLLPTSRLSQVVGHPSLHKLARLSQMFPRPCITQPLLLRSLIILILTL